MHHLDLDFAQTRFHMLDMGGDAALERVADENHGVRRRILRQTEKIESHTATLAVIRFEVLSEARGIVWMLSEQSSLAWAIFGVRELGERNLPHVIDENILRQNIAKA